MALFELLRRGRKPGIIFLEGKAAGINLSQDDVTEHEMGIDGIKEELGIPLKAIEKGLLGIPGRKTTKMPKEKFLTGTKEGYSYLVFDCRGALARNGAWKDEYLHLRDGVDLAAAWSVEGFGILIRGEHEKFIAKLFGAFQAGDVVLGLGPRVPFGNQDLIILIASRIPQETAREIHDGDLKIFRETRKAREINKGQEVL